MANKKLIFETPAKSWGFALGRAVVWNRDVIQESALAESGISLEEALELLKKEYAALSEKDEIFLTHAEIAEDPALREHIESALNEGLKLYDAAEKACTDLTALFEQIDDEYLRARKDDLRDVFGQLKKIIANPDGCRKRLASCGSAEKDSDSAGTYNNQSEECGSKGCTGSQNGSPEKEILVADEFFPSDAADIDFTRVGGLISELGNRTGHICIIAKSKGIPMLTGIKGCTKSIKTGDTVILDADNGRITVNPDPETLAEAQSYGKKYSSGISPSVAKIMKTYAEAGVKVFANAGNLEDVRRAINFGAAGIGLFRSEFLFMSHPESMPDENAQFEIYKTAAEICNGKQITIRTLDIGGDKSLPYLSQKKEENPFLGCRAIRLCLIHPEIFKPQLRAILRASAYGNVRIMIPMICTVAELEQTYQVIEECKSELRNEHLDFNENIPVGIMTETPATVMKASDFAAKSDFFSIGSNDLTQYIMVADRGNSDVSTLYDWKDKAVLDSIKILVDAADNAGIDSEICGEMGADPDSVSALIELGVKAVSIAIR